MTRTTADQESRSIRAQIVHYKRTGAHTASFAIIGEHEAFKEFVGALERVVDDLFGWIGVAHEMAWGGERERQF
jgi:hypothetical protein